MDGPKACCILNEDFLKSSIFEAKWETSSPKCDRSSFSSCTRSPVVWFCFDFMNLVAVFSKVTFLILFPIKAIETSIILLIDQVVAVIFVRSQILADLKYFLWIQLISKCPFGVFKSTKKTNKCFKGFLP